MQNDQSPQSSAPMPSEPGGMPLPSKPAGSMPTPLTPLPPIDDSPAAAKPIDGANLAALLKQADGTAESILSQHPPIEAGTPMPGSIIEPKPATPFALPTIQPRPVVSPLPQMPPRPTPVPPPPTPTRPTPGAPPMIETSPPPQPPPKPMPVPPPQLPRPAVSLPPKPLPRPSVVSPPPAPTIPSMPITIEPDNELQAPRPQRRRYSLRLGGLLRNHRPFFWLLVSVASLSVAFATPWSRYHLAALIIKNDFSIQVLDSTTGDPVSDALVTIGSKTVNTDGSGRTVLRGLNPGSQLIAISKQYYEDQQIKVLIPILDQKTTPRTNLQTTGSLIKIGVTNLITKQPLGGVYINAGLTKAHTNSNGYALLAVPADSTFQSGELSLSGYNSVAAKLSVKGDAVLNNDITLTPSGKAYFLAKSKGLINLMSANLDGTGRQVLMAASGYEDSSTLLLASPSHKFLAIVGRRTADPHPQIYVFDTTKNKAAEVAFGAMTFKLYGWSDDSLIYSVALDNVNTWQTGKNKLMSYNATTQKSNTINQALAAGSSKNSAYQTYGGVLVTGDTVLYGLNWVGVGDNAAGLMAGKANLLMANSADGSNLQTIASYDAAKYLITYRQSTPSSLSLRQISIAGAADQFFGYSVGDPKPTPALITLKQFNQSYPRHFASPGLSQTIWTQTIAGKNTILVGDKIGQNSSTLLSDTSFSAFGWATDQYALLTKAGSLYVMGAGNTPLKISEYFDGQ